MRVFVFENVCGGGMAGEPLPAGMVAQGRAMLEAVARDFLRCGARVALSRDARVDVVVDGADIVESNGRSDEALVEAGAAGADAVLVIAPETNGVLERLTRCLARLPVRSLGSSPQAVRLCADKLHMARRLASRGIATPPTRLCPGDGRAPDGPSGVDTLVVKPRDGAGCENTFVHARGQVVAGDPRWIVQPYVPGLAASVSFVVAVDGRPRPLPAGNTSNRRTVSSPIAAGGCRWTSRWRVGRRGSASTRCGASRGCRGSWALTWCSATMRVQTASSRSTLA
jgi:predicted ATP-grasp superfamily ATP-dependent carboligase